MMRRTLAVTFSLICFLTATLSLPARAAMISTQDTLAAASRTGDLQTVQTWLQRDEVRAEMLAYGVAPEWAAERAASLADEDLRQLAGKIDAAPAGGDALGLIGAVFIVLLILELVGVINVFNRF